MASTTVTLHGASGKAYDQPPIIQATVTYGTVKRSGTKLKCSVTVSLKSMGSGHYFGYNLVVKADLDGGTKKTVFTKPNSPSTWNDGDYKGTVTVTSTNKTTSCKLHIRVSSNCGCNSGDLAVMKTITLSAPEYSSGTGTLVDIYSVNFYDSSTFGGTLLKSESVESGNNATPPSAPSHSGYVFSGWSGSYQNVTSNQSVYATYTQNNYTVTYNANGGSGAPATQTKQGGVALTLSSQVPTRSYTVTLNGNGGSTPNPIIVSYTFKGWNTKADGSGTTYQPGSTYNSDASLILYAIWEQKAFSLTDSVTKKLRITYNAMGGSVSPAYKDVSCTFLGWYTAPTGGTKVTNSTPITSNITVYAHWSNPKAGDLATPTKSNSKFINWYKETSYNTLFNKDSVVSENITIYAKWNSKIILNANGGVIFDGEDDYINKEYWKEDGVDFTIPVLTVTYAESIDGTISRTFSGWNTKADGTGTTYQPGGKYTLNSPVILYAQYVIKKYTVRWLKGYGTSQVIKTMTVNHGTTLNDTPEPSGDFPKDPTRSGYAFAGWRGDWYNITKNTDIVAMWSFSPIWIYKANVGWVPYETTDPDDKDED